MNAKTLRALALATTCLWPLTAMADDNDFDLGEPSATPAPTAKPVLVNEAGTSVGVQAGGHGRFNRYRSGHDDGAVNSSWFSVQSRDTGKDDGTFYFQAEGDGLDFSTNKVLPDASGAVTVGEQGLWNASVAYDGLAFLQSDNYHTMFGSSGEYLGGKPKSLNVTATNAAGVARAKGYLQAVDVGTRRDRITGTLGYAGIPDWDIGTKLEHEHKQGTKINSVFFYNSNAFAAIPEPVDYDTDRFTATAAYTTRPVQAQFSYILSKFTNNQQSFQTVTPYNLTAAQLIPGYQQSELSLPPSNQEHRIKMQLGANPGEKTHVAVNLSYALQMQDENYNARLYERSPKTGDKDFDGLIRNAYGNVALTSRPRRDWNFRAAYTVDDRQNDSQMYKFGAPYRADGTSAFNGSGAVTVNPAYSFLNQRADLEAGYRLTKATKVTVDYSYKDSQRDYTVTSRNQESILGSRVNSTLAPGLTGSLGYARGIRQATEYRGNNGWADLGRTLTGANSEERLRMYNYAARERDEIKGALTWSPTAEWALGANARLVDDEFPSTYFGVTDNRAVSVGPDISFTPSKDFSAGFYYTYQDNFNEQMVYNPNNANNAEWRLKNRDTVHTLGARAEWQMNERWKLTADNNLSYGNTAFEEASWWRGTGTYTAITSLPDNKTITNTLRVSGEYALTDNVFVGLNALWERLLSKDYLNAQEAASSANQTGTATIGGEGNPGYSAAVVMATTRLVW